MNKLLKKWEQVATQLFNAEYVEIDTLDKRIRRDVRIKDMDDDQYEQAVIETVIDAWHKWRPVPDAHLAPPFSSLKLEDQIEAIQMALEGADGGFMMGDANNPDVIRRELIRLVQEE